MYTIDFETEKIEDYPKYPPKPVGVAIKHNDEDAHYFAWGHPTHNNCTEMVASLVLNRVWASEESLLFQKAKFDLEVARKWFGLETPSERRVEDSMFLIFLDNPLAPTFSLKPSAERILGLRPTEQEEVRNWLVAHHIVPSNSKSWGAHICKAPGYLVGQYAIGDVDRTYAIYRHLSRTVHERGMTEAYRREVKLTPILADNERRGIRCDTELLRTDLRRYKAEFERATQAAKIILRQDNYEFNIDSGVQLAAAIQGLGCCVPLNEWPLTKTKRFSTSKDTLRSVIRHPELAALLEYRATLKTCLGTFMEPWLEKAGKCNGLLHPHWNQVKGIDYGTKTGRLSSSDPNFQNIPTEFTNAPPEGYLPYPLLRSYILPDEGEILVSADFHSQEIRMLGHFAEGAIKRIYDSDPSADIHAVAAEIIHDETGLRLTRKQTKIVAFSILYGVGMGNLADRLGVSYQEARHIKQAYLNALSGVEEFMDEVESRASSKRPVRSWGGRLLHAPAPVIREDGRVWDKDYVLLNYLIQGSSADQTKQAMIEYDRTKRHGRLIATVHDEIVISVAPEYLDDEVRILCAAMESGEFDIPMRATVKIGPNWADMCDYPR